MSIPEDDMLFWRVAIGLNALDKVNIFKWEYTLPDFMQLVEMLDIKNATETARHKDEELNQNKGRK